MDPSPENTAPAPAPSVRTAIPRYDINPQPPYPRSAKRRGYEGAVVLSVLVLEDGLVGSIEVAESSGYKSLDKSALDAVKKWRFIPATEDDKPVPMTVQVPIRFTLK